MIKKVFTINGQLVTVNGETAHCGKHFVMGKTWEEALGKVVALISPGVGNTVNLEEPIKRWKAHLAGCYKCEVASLDPTKVCGTGYGLLQPIKESL